MISFNIANWGASQWLFIIILFTYLVQVFEKNGQIKEQETYDFNKAIISTFITLLILGFGGFWG